MRCSIRGDIECIYTCRITNLNKILRPLTLPPRSHRCWRQDRLPWSPLMSTLSFSEAWPSRSEICTLTWRTWSNILSKSLIYWIYRNKNIFDSLLVHRYVCCFKSEEIHWASQGKLNWSIRTFSNMQHSENSEFKFPLCPGANCPYLLPIWHCLVINKTMF